MSKATYAKSEKKDSAQGITGISVRGYKSLYEECSVEIRPLTIIAGANSSGKSSIMQPLLLLKQTLEATYDPALPKAAEEVYKRILEFREQDSNVSEQIRKIKIQWGVRENRWFLELALGRCKEKLAEPSLRSINNSPSELFEHHIRKVIHVPGLRGNPERTYRVVAVGRDFQGTFENSVASAVNHWQKTEDKRLQDLGRFLETLGLTCKVGAQQVDDTQVELQVGRLPRRGQVIDMVSIADVGFGVSQVLPVLVALLVAEPGELVYLEQPEIHLHPRAQAALAEVLAEAASRGVRVVLETHSELLLLAVQSLVAEGKLLPDAVKLHWFTRREDGVTEVSSAELDEAGSFGDWPADLGDVSVKLESRYLDDAEARLFNGWHGSKSFQTLA